MRAAEWRRSTKLLMLRSLADDAVCSARLSGLLVCTAYHSSIAYAARNAHIIVDSHAATA
jgi:hypothetical protein